LTVEWDFIHELFPPWISFLLLLQKLLPFSAVLSLLYSVNSSLISIVDRATSIVLLLHLCHELFQQYHLLLQKTPFHFSLGDHINEIGFLFAPKKTHNILVNLLVVLMKEPVLLIALMSVVLYLVLLINMFLIQLPEDELDLPLDYIWQALRTPISSILYFFISSRK
jgi:hypothetical protein